MSADKVRLGGDLAALYISHGADPVREPGTRRICIALCNFPGFGAHELQSLITATVDALASTASPLETDHVFVVSLNSNADFGDDELSLLAAKELANRNVQVSLVRYTDTDVDHIWALLGSMDGLIAVRLHAAICAYMNSVPFVLLEYHQKCRDFCDDVGQNSALRASSTPSRDAARRSITALFSAPSPTKVTPSDYATRARSVYFGEG